MRGRGGRPLLRAWIAGYSEGAVVMDYSYSPVSFSDSDEFAEWESSLGWDIESNQVSYGPNSIGFDHFEFPGLAVGHFHAAQSQVDFFELPPGIVVFIIFRAKLPAVWNGRIIPPSQMAIVRAGTNHTARLPAGWDCYEFLADEELIRRTELFPLEFFDKTIRIEDACLPLPEPLTERFLARLDHCFTQVRRGQHNGDEPVDGAALYDFLLHGLREVIDAGLAGSGEPPSWARRADLIPVAREFMDANLRNNLTADEIAQALDVSYRSLHYAFRESFGVSPYRYFLTRRLSAVRRQLKEGRLTVSQASVAHGFYTPSRFTRQYRRLFGELPSETRNGS